MKLLITDVVIMLIGNSLVIFVTEKQNVQLTILCIIIGVH